MTSIWYRCITHLSLPNAEWDKIGLERRRTCTRSLRKELEMDGRVAHKEAHHVAQERVQGRGRRIVRDPSPLALSGHSGFKIKGRWDWGQTLPCGCRDLLRRKRMERSELKQHQTFCYTELLLSRHVSRHFSKLQLTEAACERWLAWRGSMCQRAPTPTSQMALSRSRVSPAVVWTPPTPQETSRDSWGPFTEMYKCRHALTDANLGLFWQGIRKRIKS